MSADDTRRVFADTQADVGRRRRCECRPAWPTSADDTRRHSLTLRPTSADDVGVSVGELEKKCRQPTSAWCPKMSAADVGVAGRRRPPTSTILSVMEPPISLFILRNFSLYVAIHFNSTSCNSPSLIATYPFAPIHRSFLPLIEFLLKKSVRYPRLEPATSLLHS